MNQKLLFLLPFTFLFPESKQPVHPEHDQFDLRWNGFFLLFLEILSQIFFCAQVLKQLFLFLVYPSNFFNNFLDFFSGSLLIYDRSIHLEQDFVLLGWHIDFGQSLTEICLREPVRGKEVHDDRRIHFQHLLQIFEIFDEHGQRSSMT